MNSHLGRNPLSAAVGTTPSPSELIPINEAFLAGQFKKVGLFVISALKRGRKGFARDSNESRSCFEFSKIKPAKLLLAADF